MHPHPPPFNRRHLRRLTAGELPLRTDEARERPEEPVEARELPLPEPEARLLNRVTPRCLIGTIQLAARGVSHLQSETVFLAQPHQPTDQLLHVRRLR